MALRLDERLAAPPATPAPSAESLPSGVDVPALRFDRRREARAQTAGWARVICFDPYKSFLGGTVELADVSHSGLGLRSEQPLPVGEFVEVRLAPFRVRGRVAVVARCDEVPETLDEATGDVQTPRHYHIGVQLAQTTRAA